MYGRLKFFMILLIILSATVFALEPDERTYFDQQNQKIVAQLTQKIDTQTNRVEQNLKKEVENVKNEVKDEMRREINSALQSVAIGLAGLIIVTLAVFKVIDLRLSSTRNIDKYEKQLQEKIKEHDSLIADAKKESETLLKYRNELRAYHQQLQAVSRGYNITPVAVAQLPEKKIIEPPKPKKSKKKKWILWMLVGLFIIVVIAIIIYFILKSGNTAPVEAIKPAINTTDGIRI